jgi:hypothetical protein
MRSERSRGGGGRIRWRQGAVANQRPIAAVLDHPDFQRIQRKVRYVLVLDVYRAGFTRLHEFCPGRNDCEFDRLVKLHFISPFSGIRERGFLTGSLLGVLHGKSTRERLPERVQAFSTFLPYPRHGLPPLRPTLALLLYRQSTLQWSTSGRRSKPRSAERGE